MLGIIFTPPTTEEEQTGKTATLIAASREFMNQDDLRKMVFDCDL